MPFVEDVVLPSKNKFGALNISPLNDDINNESLAVVGVVLREGNN
jgi:hypothetical protein